MEYIESLPPFPIREGRVKLPSFCRRGVGVEVKKGGSRFN
jgi:hypothetical protein